MQDNYRYGVIMDNLLVIGILALAAFVVGAILFFPMRWWALRSVPSGKKIPTITPFALIIAVAVVLVFLGPFVLWVGFSGDAWVRALFGNNRVLLFYLVAYGAILVTTHWLDGIKGFKTSWWNKPIGTEKCEQIH